MGFKSLLLRQIGEIPYPLRCGVFLLFSMVCGVSAHVPKLPTVTFNNHIVLSKVLSKKEAPRMFSEGRINVRDVVRFFERRVRLCPYLSLLYCAVEMPSRAPRRVQTTAAVLAT